MESTATDRKFRQIYSPTWIITILVGLILIALLGISFILFKKPPNRSIPPAPLTTKGCVPSGCSGTICQDEGTEPMYTTCEYREEFACYKFARCERQSDGQCRWTATTAFTTCIDQINR